MKKCPLCGKEYDSEIKCISCGVFLIDMDTNRAVSGNSGKKHIRAEKKTASGKNTSTEGASPGDDPITAALLGGFPAQEKREKTEKNAEPDEPVEKPVSTETVAEADTDTSRNDQDWYDKSIFETSGTRRKGSEGASQTVTNNEKDNNVEKRSLGEKKSVTITFNPALVAVCAVVILVIVAAVFIVKGLSEKNDQTVAPVVQEDVTDMPDVPEEPEQEPDLSSVTLNAYEADYLEISGRVEDYSGTLRFLFDTTQNIYLYDNYAQEAEVVEYVTDVSLDPAAPCALDMYAGRQVTVRGNMWKEGSNILFSAWEVLYAEPEEDDPGIHQYQIVTEDCTWYDAFARSAAQGGYLARISSPEEYEYIAGMLNDSGYTNIHFYLGGRRADDGTEYYWINDQNEFMGDCLNSSDSWTSSYWFENEPSFYDTGAGSNGEIAENVMNLFFVSGTWYLNDSSDDLAGQYPDLLSGKVGYIIEYE